MSDSRALSDSRAVREGRARSRGPEAAGDEGLAAGDEGLVLANEFAEVRVRVAHTRNGDRLLVESPRTGHQVLLCPLELQALTWQGAATFSAMMAKPWEALVEDDEPVEGDAPAERGAPVEDVP